MDQSAGGNAKVVFRDWHDRLNFAAPAVQSNPDDPEILIHIPFDGSVKLKAICVIGDFLQRAILIYATREQQPDDSEKWQKMPK